MKIAVFGTLPFSDLIKEGFKKLGHQISNEDPDLIFSNDPLGYQDAIFLKTQYPKVQLILNILDIPWHFPNIEKQYQHLIKRFFSKAENITTISFKVKKDLAKIFDPKIFWGPKFFLLTFNSGKFSKFENFPKIFFGTFVNNFFVMKKLFSIQFFLLP